MRLWIAGWLLVGWSGLVHAEFVDIYRGGFEEAHIVGAPSISTVLTAGQSASAQTPDGTLTVQNTSSSSTAVTAGTGLNEGGETGTIIQIEGGPARFDFGAVRQVHSGPGSVGCASDPADIAANYPTRGRDNCWGTRPYWYLSLVRHVAEVPVDYIGAARLPGEAGLTGEFTEPSAWLYGIRTYNPMQRIGAQLNGCSHADCSLRTDSSGVVPAVRDQDAPIVLLVHGYQPEPGLSFIADNGGYDYFGKLPERLIADGYYPFEFRWLTNTRFSDAADDLAWAITTIKNTTGKQVHVVAHSFGGLLARSLLQRDVDGAYGGVNTVAARAAVASLTTVGTPHSGIADGISNFFGTKVPLGQDSALFEGCGQITCHVAGENVLGTDLAEALGVLPDPGESIDRLTRTINQLPAIPIKVLVGLNYHIFEGGQMNVAYGDGLITGWGQRFKPTLALDGTQTSHAWNAFLTHSAEAPGASVSEVLLGRNIESANVSTVKPGDPRPALFRAFKHSKSTIGPEDQLEVEVPAAGFHDAYARIREGLPAVALPLSGVVSVSAGGPHTCALLNTGTVKCWGYNNAGQLGDGTNVDRYTPVAVSGLNSGVAAISTGTVHTCALLTTGALLCWGSNEAGQLGDGTGVDSATPVSVLGLGDAVAEVHAGYSHTCARLVTGALKCWGSNYVGELGDGTGLQSDTPVAVSGLGSGVATFSTGEAFSCAVMNSGSVKCWGHNGGGQLGDGTRTDRLSPVSVSGLSSGTIAVGTGGSHTCALLNSGAVKCWGDNYFGQLGDGTTVGRNTPTQVSGLTSGIANIGVGRNHTCALVNTGSVKCWGENQSGQLGIGNTTNRSTPTLVLGLSTASGLSGGRWHNCVRRTDASVQCWGQNYAGALGDGTTIDRLTPVTVLSGN